MTIISETYGPCHFIKIAIHLACVMDIQQPIRSYQLKPLSQEHRDGMLYINRLREGLGRISIERLNQYTRWYWKNHIRPHFFQEERILLPYTLVLIGQSLTILDSIHFH